MNVRVKVELKNIREVLFDSLGIQIHDAYPPKWRIRTPEHDLFVKDGEVEIIAEWDVDMYRDEM